MWGHELHVTLRSRNYLSFSEGMAGAVRIHIYKLQLIVFFILAVNATKQATSVNKVHESQTKWDKSQ